MHRLGRAGSSAVERPAFPWTISSGVERLDHNQEVAGSNPASSTGGKKLKKKKSKNKKLLPVQLDPDDPNFLFGFDPETGQIKPLKEPSK